MANLDFRGSVWGADGFVHPRDDTLVVPCSNEGATVQILQLHHKQATFLLFKQLLNSIQRKPNLREARYILSRQLHSANRGDDMHVSC
jgi:hypothetical protein